MNKKYVDGAGNKTGGCFWQLWRCGDPQEIHSARDTEGFTVQQPCIGFILAIWLNLATALPLSRCSRNAHFITFHYNLRQ